MKDEKLSRYESGGLMYLGVEQGESTGCIVLYLFTWKDRSNYL